VGPTGAQGLPGLAANTGPTGLQGIPGTATNTGAQGPQGVTGPTGPIGLQGIPGTATNTGAVGAGFPSGGTTGQVLAKIDATNYNTQWISGVGNIIGPYIIKLTSSGIGVGAFVSATDLTGTPLVGWTVNIPTTSSVEIVYPSSITGTFINFRRMAANTGSAPFTYTVGAYAPGFSGASVTLTPSSQTILFTNISNTTYFFSSGVDCPIYLMFDLMQTPPLP
jgi:hypothetical protein